MILAPILASLVLTSFNEGWEYKWNDQAAWMPATAPHDAQWGRPFDATVNLHQGYVTGGSVSYRKRFARPATDARLSVRFDCVYADSKVFLNGKEIGGRHSGYVPFEVPLAGLADDNLLEVVCDAQIPNARWYVGAGLLRDVHLVARKGFALEPEKVFVETSVEGKNARVRVTVEEAEVVEPRGGEYVIPDCPLWSPEHPNLQTVRVTARNAAGETDSTTIRFGVKSAVFTLDRGLLLNGERYPIKGICLHETLGCLGGAYNHAAMKRMLAKLKPMGVNAIRTSHNPYAPRFFDLCDELGFLVMDELFDEWNLSKDKFGYWRFFETDCLRDLETIVRRDRNRASLLVWSVGNEIRDMSLKDERGRKARDWARKLTDRIHALDRAHPVSAGCNGARFKQEASGAPGELDVVGINYAPGDYAFFKGKWPVFGSETAAVPSTRDTYLFKPEKDGRMTIVPSFGSRQSSYLTSLFDWSPDIGTSVGVQRRRPYSAGEFIWSAYDYVGEPLLPNVVWPTYSGDRTAEFGCFDHAGFAKDRFYVQQAAWTDRPMAHLLPNWTHPGFKGAKFPVWCFTNCEEAELFLNGKSQGVRRAESGEDLKPLVWEVAYAPGTLEVRAKAKDGTVVTDRRVTAGSLARYAPSVDFEDGEWTFVRIDAVDARGTRILTCENLVRVHVQGAELVATDNGDPACWVPFSSTVRPLFHGSLLAVLRRTPGKDYSLRIEEMK